MNIQLTSKEDVRLAIKILIDQYSRYVSRLDPDLDIVVVVNMDRSYQAYDCQLWFTSQLAPCSHDPRYQTEDERDHLDTIVPVTVSIEKLEKEVTDILDKLSQIKTAA